MTEPAIWIDAIDLELDRGDGCVAAQFKPTQGFVPLYKETPIDAPSAVKKILRSLKDRSGFDVLDDPEIEAEIASELEDVLTRAIPDYGK